MFPSMPVTSFGQPMVMGQFAYPTTPMLYFPQMMPATSYVPMSATVPVVPTGAFVAGAVGGATMTATAAGAAAPTAGAAAPAANAAAPGAGAAPTAGTAPTAGFAHTGFAPAPNPPTAVGPSGVGLSAVGPTATAPAGHVGATSAAGVEIRAAASASNALKRPAATDTADLLAGIDNIPQE